MMQQPQKAPKSFAAFVGIDWGDQEHAVAVRVDGELVSNESLRHSPEAITAWAQQLHKQFDGQHVAVGIEQARGPLIYALMAFEHLVLFPINPKQAASYREALSASGKKDDPSDAQMLARFLAEHHDVLRQLSDDDGVTRKLTQLCELRRKVVETRKKTVQQLTSALKQYYPQALEIGGPLQSPQALELLSRWPSLKQLQREHPRTLRKFLHRYGRRNEDQVKKLATTIRAMQPLTHDEAIIDTQILYVELLVKEIKLQNQAVERFDEQIALLFSDHEDAHVFESLPGAGAALAPRLSAAMGTDRERFSSAEEVECCTGIAPVTKQSGKTRHVQRRVACNKFLRQTFHEFANHARRWSTWSKAYYQLQRDRGVRHHAAIRALAYKWIRIIYRMWKDRTEYDEDRYIKQLHKTNSPIVKYLPKP